MESTCSEYVDAFPRSFIYTEKISAAVGLVIPNIKQYAVFGFINYFVEIPLECVQKAGSNFALENAVLNPQKITP